jgi:hypothetical protein
MIETSSKIVQFKNDLSMIIKKYEVVGHELKPDQQMKLISILERIGIIAIRSNEYNSERGKHMFCVLTEYSEKMPTKPINVDQWDYSFNQLGNAIKIEIKNPNQRSFIEDFYLRKAQHILKGENRLWVYKGNSGRQFYEISPFNSSDEIDGYRRYDLSTKYIEDIGLSINVEVKTAYFTKFPVEYYFLNNLEEKFAKLSERYKDLEYLKYKGTLLFKGPNYFTKCYFVEFCRELNLSTTPSFSINSKKYEHAYDYYRKEYPEYGVKPDDTAALVSFPFGDNTRRENYVPAKKIFLRVMNSALEGDLSREDKINPKERKIFVTNFWDKLGNKPFGDNYAGLESDFYRPSARNSGSIKLPTLKFGNKVKLKPPQILNKEEYKSHYRKVLENLGKNGCYFVPKVMDRNLHFVFPKNVSDKAKERFVDDLTKTISIITKYDIEPIVNPYEDATSACMDLQNSDQPGMVAFVFENVDPATYYNISYELSSWKIKRITSYELNKKFNRMELEKKYSFSSTKKMKEERKWDSFINLIAFGIVQELGCIPYTFEEKLNYGMHIVIDVSEKFQFFGIGLMIYSDEMPYPVIDSITKPKRKRNDIIEPPILEKYFREILKRNSATIKQYEITKVLALRDGQEFGTEYDSLNKVITEFKGNELPDNFSLDFVEYHKNTANEVRLWESVNARETQNVLEGTYVKLDNKTLLLATTGVGTLGQGTARPILIYAKHANPDLDKIAFDVFISSQLNYNSPSVSQRLTLLAKRIDDLLLEKKAQYVEQLR